MSVGSAGILWPFSSPTGEQRRGITHPCKDATVTWKWCDIAVMARIQLWFPLRSLYRILGLPQYRVSIWIVLKFLRIPAGCGKLAPSTNSEAVLQALLADSQTIGTESDPWSDEAPIVKWYHTSLPRKRHGFDSRLVQTPTPQGHIVQLVERSFRIREVFGSIPDVSISKILDTTKHSMRCSDIKHSSPHSYSV